MVFGEIARLKDIIEPTRFVATTAILHSEDIAWAWNFVAVERMGALMAQYDISAQGRILEWYQPFYEAKISTDILDPLRDLSGYKVVFCPNLYLVTPQIAEHLRAYVRDGGMLILGPKAGLKDWSNTFYEDIPPCGGLSELFGVTVKTSPFRFGHTSGPAPRVTMTADAPFARGMSFENRGLFDYLEPTTARVIACHSSGDAAVTTNACGQGQAIYLGCMPERRFHHLTIEWLESEGLIVPALKTDADVEVTVREGGGRRLTFVLNHNREPEQIRLPKEYRELIAQETVSGLLVVAGGGVAILCETL